jgi:hypothetical protein
LIRSYFDFIHIDEENLIDMDEIDAEEVEGCTEESVMEFVEPTQDVTHLSQLNSSRPKCWQK